MKILHTCLSRSWGGMEMYSLSTVCLLRTAGIDVELLCSPGSRLHHEALRAGVEVHTLTYPRIDAPVSVIRTARLIVSKKYELIHSEASKDLWIIVPALKLSRSRAPLLLTKHVGSFIVKKDPLHRWIYRRVNRALAVSSVIQKNLLDTTPLETARITLLHDAVDTARFNPASVNRAKVRAEFDIRDDEILIGITSRFSPGKGHEEFLRSASDLCRTYSNLRFLIVGEPSAGEGAYAEGIRAMAETLELSGRVIFTGYRTDMPEILAALDIFVFPSHAEAFGMSLVEAMSMEKPSVCSNTDGIIDIAVDGVTSLLFERTNHEELTVKIERLVAGPGLRRELGVNARKRVLENFSYDIFISRLMSVYRSEIAEPSS